MPDPADQASRRTVVGAIRGTHRYTQEQRDTAYSVAMHLTKYLGPQRFILTVEPDDTADDDR